MLISKKAREEQERESCCHSSCIVLLSAVNYQPVFCMILTSLSTKADLYQPLAVSCVNFRRWNVTWSASVMSVIQPIQHFCFQTCCNAFSPAPWIPLDYQLHVPRARSRLHIYFSFVFPTSQLWKRARTHTDAVVYVSRVFMLFIVWSIAFTELCSNRCRFIYYDENFHCESCRFFQSCTSCPRFILDRLSVCPVHLSSTACG